MSTFGENIDHHINAVDFATGQITPEERQVMESHLAGCAHCQTAVKAVQQGRAQSYWPKFPSADRFRGRSTGQHSDISRTNSQPTCKAITTSRA